MPDQQKKSNIPAFGPNKLGAHLFGSWDDPRQILYDDFHIERIEVYKDHLVMPVLPHRRSVFFFMYVTSGRVVRSKLLNQYEVLPDHLFFLADNVTTTIEYIAPETTGYYCHFSPAIFESFRPVLDLVLDFPFFDLTASPIRKAFEKERLRYLLHALEQEYHKKDRKRLEVIPLYLLALLTEVKLANAVLPNSQPVKDAAARLTMRYRKALSTFIYEKSKVFEYAEYLSVSPNHLNKCVKIVTGKSAHDLLAEMKILEAKVLLAQTSLGIGDIAFKIGNMGQSDFSRFFKAKTGYTPKQYRKISN